MNHIKLSVIFLLSTLLATSGWSIVNGQELDSKNTIRNFLVNIKFKNGMCTGSVIAPHVILTAAHCRDIMGEAELVAQITGSPTVPCNISKVIETSFAPGAVQDLPLNVHSPDILLLKLESPLCQVGTAELHFDVPKTNDSLQASGYGQGSFPFGKAHTFLFSVIDNSNISNYVTPLNQWDEQLLILAPRTYIFGLPIVPGSSVCSGDSGGPVTQEIENKTKLVGVSGAALPHSKLGASCDQKYLQLFTPLAPYKDWIESQLKEWSIK